MQQNVTEIWGLMLQIGDPGGAFVRGVFQPIAFNSIWQNSQGKKTPHSSASGSGVYQSTLTDLVWKNPEGPGHSSVLDTLQKLAEQNVSDKYPGPRLSVNMVVNTHNNLPPTYLFDQEKFQAMNARGVPADVTNKLQDLATFSILKGEQVGQIPTSNYVNYLLKTLLGEQVANQYGETILDVTKQPYDTVMPTNFTYGHVVGSIGPAGVDEPEYAVPVRTLAPLVPLGPNDPPPPIYFAPAKLRSNGLTLDLGNSLKVELPGRPHGRKS